MKKIILPIAFSLILKFLPAQEIQVNPLYSVSSSNSFHDCYGFSFGYNQFVSQKIRLGISSSLSFCTGTFEKNLYPNGGPDEEKWVKVDPVNLRLAVEISAGFHLLAIRKFSMWFGPEVGFNYFHLHEKVNLEPEMIIDNESRINFGAGIFTELQVKEIFNKHTSFFFASHRQITGFGAQEPIDWYVWGLGYRYKW